MALGYVDSDMPSIIADEHVQNSLAIQRMSRLVKNDNESGVCQNEDCGLPIPRARLLAIPGARFCVDCQSKADHTKMRVVARRAYTHI
jgi:phage/conjugal plasmid C-4 type zinc finger TraR family protein